MLQQTQVDRVIPKYHEFLERYPTLEELSRAPVDELRKVWYPLGYNIRPMRLRKIAQQAVEQHGGRIPDTYDGLIAMEGIGRYTAGAVLSFAFNQDAPILDTNVARLLQRYFGLVEDRGLRSRLWQLAGEVIPRGRGYDINQAMMDFGAMICTARRPLCGGCALRGACRTFPLEPVPTPPVACAGPSREPRKARGARRTGLPYASDEQRRAAMGIGPALPATPSGLRRQAAISCVAPPWRSAATTPASLLLGAGRLAPQRRLREV